MTNFFNWCAGVEGAPEYQVALYTQITDAGETAPPLVTEPDFLGYRRFRTEAWRRKTTVLTYAEASSGLLTWVVEQPGIENEVQGLCVLEVAADGSEKVWDSFAFPATFTATQGEALQIIVVANEATRILQ